MTTTSTDQSDSAAERSAHVSRGSAGTLSSLEPAVVQLSDGTWKLRVIHELEEENRKLREALRFYAGDEPWKLNSEDFGNKARVALAVKE